MVILKTRDRTVNIFIFFGDRWNRVRADLSTMGLLQPLEPVQLNVNECVQQSWK